MGPWIPVRQDARISTHLDGVLEGAGDRCSVTVLSLCEGGFFCEGFELERVGAEFNLRLDLNPVGPAWSPKPGAAGWRSQMLSGLARHTLRLKAELLYLDFCDGTGTATRKVGLGGRFTGMSEAAQDELADFIARESFRERSWRTAFGAIPAPKRDRGTGSK